MRAISLLVALVISTAVAGGGANPSSCPPMYRAERINRGTRCVYYGQSSDKAVPVHRVPGGRSPSYYCNAGTYRTGHGCLSCDKGYYQDIANVDYCNQCPDGKTTRGIGSHSSAECYYENVCHPGYSRDQYGGCAECEIGHYSSTPNAAYCPECPGGMSTRTRGCKSEHECYYENTCEAGYYHGSSGQCDPCATGYYNDKAGASHCTQCPHGMTTSRTGCKGRNECHYAQKCQPGHYREASGGCNVCNIGYYQDKYDYDHCYQCPHHMTTHNTGCVDKSACVYANECPKGTFRRGDGICEACPRATYTHSPNQDRCYPCDIGYTTKHVGTSDRSYCISIKCGQGYYRDVGGLCELCPLGTYQDKENMDHCYKCDPGMYTRNTGCASKSQCYYKETCYAGNYRNGAGHCAPCEVGYYQDKQNYDHCYQCPPGMTTHKPGCGSKNLCNYKETCHAGNYRTKEGYCSPCGVGYYQDHENYDHCYQCPPRMTTHKPGCGSKDLCVYNQQCHAGHYRKKDGYCGECGLGYYQDQINQDHCYQCPPAMTTHKPGCGSADLCVYKEQCHVGNYRQKSGYCGECGVGYYQDKINQDHCYQCPPRMTTHSGGCGSKDLCVYKETCHAGNYRKKDGYCEPCGVGYYQDKDNYDHCYQCPPAMTTHSNGCGSKDLCVYKETCHAGNYRKKDGYCDACGVGYYQDKENYDHCYQCPPAMTTHKPGCGSKDLCVYKETCHSGHYRKLDGYCEPCGIGYYQDKENYDHCYQCAPGMTTHKPGCGSKDLCVYRDTCHAGNYRKKDGFCEACGVGYYQDKENYDHCYQCPHGQTTHKPGCGSKDLCVYEHDCEAGYYRQDGGRCDACPMGHYQDHKNYDHCNKCPHGMTTRITGCSRQDQCIWEYSCHAGYYRGDHGKCEMCGYGYYQGGDDHYECMKCPDGMTTSGKVSANIRDCYHDGGYVQPQQDCYPGTYRGQDGGCHPCQKGYYQTKRSASSCRKCPGGLTTRGMGSKFAGACYYGRM